MTQTFDPARTRTTLYSGFIEAAAKHGRDKVILEDADGNSLTYARLTLASLVLGGRIKKMTRAGENVGILLPNAVGLAITLLGLNAYDRVAVVLNFTAGKKALTSAIRTAQLRTVLTSRRFVEAGKLEELIEALSVAEYAPGAKTRIVYLEDVRASIGIFDKLAGVVTRRTRQIHLSRQRPRKPTSRPLSSSPRGPKALPRASY